MADPWSVSFIAVHVVFIYFLFHLWFKFRESTNIVKKEKSNLRKHVLVVHNVTICIITIITVKILKIGTPEIITIIVLQLEQLDFTVQHCVQKMQTE